MRIVFMGSAPLGRPALERLAAGSDRLAGLVCQPDRPKGRRLSPAPCETKTAAAALGIPILTPEDVNAPESLDALRELRPDVFVVIAYGQILKRPLLDLAPRGCVNVHASLLPKYRGAAPIQWAIASGERETGLTAMAMNARMDAGDILEQRPVAIGEEETAGELQERLATAAADLLDGTLRAIREARVRPRPQDETEATYAPKLRKNDGRIDWCLHADTIRNRVRGFNPWPMCWCRSGDPSAATALRVLRARVEERDGWPGEVLAVDGDGPLVAAGRGSVRLCEVQPPGKRAMSGNEYLAGHGMAVGEKLF
jgi:methionyl-tRNA formyltransferase